MNDLLPAVKLIIEFEGFREKAYLCPAGIPTIGYGFTVLNGEKVKLCDSITREKADKILFNLCEDICEKIKKLVKVDISNNQLNALVSFCYNLGLGSFKHSTLLENINEKEFKDAADEFMRWTRAAGKILPGLVKRRQAEKDLFLKS